MWTLIFDDRTGTYWWVQVIEFGYQDEYGECAYSEGWTHPEDCWVAWSTGVWMNAKVEGNW